MDYSLRSDVVETEGSTQTQHHLSCSVIRNDEESRWMSAFRTLLSVLGDSGYSLDVDFVVLVLVIRIVIVVFPNLG